MWSVGGETIVVKRRLVREGGRVEEVEERRKEHGQLGRGRRGPRRGRLTAALGLYALSSFK